MKFSIRLHPVRQDCWSCSALFTEVDRARRGTCRWAAPQGHPFAGIAEVHLRPPLHPPLDSVHFRA
ncbi:MAG: hypothetical protein MUC41_12415 [Syntrophobacteraceae bacterium]|nr:hypothetical protein [Syntrophobacteraceae bacterium]